MYICIYIYIYIYTHTQIGARRTSSRFCWQCTHTHPCYIPPWLSMTRSMHNGLSRRSPPVRWKMKRHFNRQLCRFVAVCCSVLQWVVVRCNVHPLRFQQAFAPSEISCERGTFISSYAVCFVERCSVMYCFAECTSSRFSMRSPPVRLKMKRHFYRQLCRFVAVCCSGV